MLEKYKMSMVEVIIILLVLFGVAGAVFTSIQNERDKPAIETKERVIETTKVFDVKPLLHAMHWRETQFSTIMDGERGSLGPYQIRKPYWIDAIEHRPEIGGRYEDCMNKEYSEKIILSYWDRYAKDCEDYETLCRLNPGGPDGPKQQCTLQYWKDVKNFLDKQGKV